MTTGRINQIAFVAVLGSESIPPRRVRPITLWTGYTNRARGFCWQLLLVSVSQRDYLFAYTFASSWTAITQGWVRFVQDEIVQLGRENVLRSELTDSYNGISRSSTRRARILLLISLGNAYSYNQFFFSAQTKSSLQETSKPTSDWYS